MNTRSFRVEKLEINSLVTIPKTLSIEIRNTADTGNVNIANTDIDGSSQSFDLGPGLAFQLNPQVMPNAPITIKTDKDSTAIIVYWVA